MVWRGRCRSAWAVPVAAAFVLFGVALLLVRPVPIGVFAFVCSVLGAIAVLALVEIEVQVTDQALRVCFSGPVRWPVASLRLADIATVEVIEVDPWRHGGWGYRGSLRLFRRAAVVLRRGPGLRLTQHDGRVFIVTVDDPEPGRAAIADRVRP